VPNKHFNLTYLGVTTLAKQGSRHPKRRLNVRWADPSGAGMFMIKGVDIDSSIETSLTKVISNNVVEVGESLSGIKSLAEAAEIVEVFPVLSVFVKATRGIKTISDLLFLNKLRVFIRPIENISKKTRSERIRFVDTEIEKGRSLFGRRVRYLINSINEEFKVELCATMYRDFFYGEIEYEDLFFCTEVIRTLANRHLNMLRKYETNLDSGGTSSFLDALLAVGIVNRYDANGHDPVVSNYQLYSEKYRLTEIGLRIRKNLDDVRTSFSI